MSVITLPQPRTESLVCAAMREVREHIRTHALRVGDTLPGEQHFAGQLGVSRAVMREAFGGLAALRLIDVGNGRRARVGAIDGSVMGTSMEHAVATEQVSIIDIWEVRRTLELRTAGMAASNRTDAQASEIVALARTLADAEDVEAIVIADIGFHQAIADATANALFHQIVRSFEAMMRISVPAAWHTRTTSEQRDRVRANHLEIATAIADKDPAAAETAMDAHFDATVIRAAMDVRGTAEPR